MKHSFLRELMEKQTSNEELSCANDDTVCFLLDEGAFVVTSDQEEQVILSRRSLTGVDDGGVGERDGNGRDYVFGV